MDPLLEKQAVASHFDSKSKVPHTSIFCVDAKVALENRNFRPTWGLHNGACGIVRVIVYGKDAPPTLGTSLTMLLWNYPSTVTHIQPYCKFTNHRTIQCFILLQLNRGLFFSLYPSLHQSLAAKVAAARGVTFHYHWHMQEQSINSRGFRQARWTKGKSPTCLM